MSKTEVNEIICSQLAEMGVNLSRQNNGVFLRSPCALAVGVILILMLSAHVIVALQEFFRQGRFQDVEDYALKFLMLNFYAAGFFV